MSNGTYVAVRATTPTINILKQFCVDNHIDMVPEQDLHVTIMYSLDNAEVVIPFKDYCTKHLASVVGYDIFGYDEDNKCLVALLDSTSLNDRHEYFKSQYHLNYTHPTYNCHVTLSIGGKYEIKDLPKIQDALVFSYEYTEELK